MGSFDRRQILRFGSLGAALGGLGALFPGRVLASTLAPEDWVGGVVPRKKLLYVFLRGGNDGLNMIYPFGDPAYYASRASIALPASGPGSGIAIGSTNCKLHPAMSDLQPLIDAQDVAFIHRVGYAGSSRSHFTAMQIYETAFAPAGGALEPYGFLARYVQEIALLGNPLPAAGFETLPRQSLLADDRALAHIPDLAAYGLPPDLVGTETEGMEAGLLGAYRLAPASDVREAGLSLLRSLDVLGGYDPAEQSSAYPANDHGAHCREALYVLGATECNVATISIGSFDTHVTQGAGTGRQADLLRDLAQCLRGVYEDASGASSPPFAPFWNDLVVLVVSEFGRTALENGSGGTDHGDGGAALVAGGSVIGKTYNCQGSTYYVSGQSPIGYGGVNALLYRTDYRAIYAEVLKRHLGMTWAQIDTIVPGYTGLSQSQPGFQPLNFLREQVPL